jgi:GNAT superfamily N-acetyltransferase
MVPGTRFLGGIYHMLIREVNESDLDGLQELYLHLHEREKLPETPELHLLWKEIIADENHHILVREVDGRIVSSVTVVIIRNLTRGMKPYALIENVVTHKDYRCRGYARTLMQAAVDIAGSSGCYKVMLMTGAKDEKTLRFYENCGFNRQDKTGVIKRIEA